MKKTENKNNNELSWTVISGILGVHFMSLAMKEYMVLVTDCSFDHGQQ